jgi:hypothetical protein
MNNVPNEEKLYDFIKSKDFSGASPTGDQCHGVAPACFPG